MMNSPDKNSRIKAILSVLPNSSGVYLMKDSENNVIYVGKAINLKNRVSSYFHSIKNLLPKTQRLVTNISNIEFIVTDNEVEALILESSLIKKYRPYYNIDLKDDKRYPFIELTVSDIFPRIFLSRRRTAKKNRMFGPFPSSDFVRRIIFLVRKFFRIRVCKDKNPKRVRPCLNYQMGKCLAPCSNKVTEEQYALSVKNTQNFLEGHLDYVIESLKEEMEKESENLNFERCKILLNDLRAVEKIAGEQKVFFEKEIDRDYISFFESGNEIVFQLLMIRRGKLLDKRHYIFSNNNDESAGDKLRAFILYYYDTVSFIPSEIYTTQEVSENNLISKWLCDKNKKNVFFKANARGTNRKLLDMAQENARYNITISRAVDKRNPQEPILQELANILNLSDIPERIETYDISNISGKMAVGSMVVFSGGKPEKREYRKFKIKSKDTPDDFAMMREVLERRFTIEKKQDEWKRKYPDLIVIDGGKGQLSSAVEVLESKQISIPVIGLAKKQEEIFLPEKQEPLILSKTAPALNLLRYGRDEAHRFAITYHRKLRGKSFLKKE